MRQRAASRRVTLPALAVLLAACGPGSGGSPASTVPIGDSSTVTIQLPEPRTTGPLSLEEALAGRRSLREYTSEPLALQDLAQLLWAAQGVTQTGGRGRAAPSAGGTYPLELYVVSPEGLFHYIAEDHLLEHLSLSDLRAPLAEAALDQSHVAEAAAIIVITAVFARTEERYGERADRYVELEAGHAAQNILLQAVALGLGAVPVGAFGDDAVAHLLGVPGDRTPLYLIPLGHPAQT